MKIAVIMSVYCGDIAADLRDSLQSLVDQSYKKFDLLLYVDGSVGADLNQIISQYSGFIKHMYRSDANLGLSVALNYMILNYFNQYDVFVRQDADDISFNNRLSVIHNLMSSDPTIDVFSSNVMEFNGEVESSKLSSYPVNDDDRVKLFSHSTIFPHVSTAIRSSYFIKAGIYPGLSFYNEDQWLWASGLSKKCKFFTYNKPLVYVRVTGHAIRRGNSLIYKNLFFMKMAMASNLRLSVLWRVKSIFSLLIRILPPSIFSILYRIYKH